MSGIAGIFYRDGRPVDARDLQSMVRVMDHRGPDGSGVWSENTAGLGQLMLHATPEAVNERLPLSIAGGDLSISADARIDNRDELLATLGIAGPREMIGDGELILRAYERWGEDCPQKLLGDFAFAIWDRREEKIFCARDHFGMKPFHFYLSGTMFAFASEIKGLLVLAGVPRRPNETRIADFLANIIADKEATFYQDILRLPPAQCLTVGRDFIRRRTYWSIDPNRRIRLKSDEAYGDAYREVFTEAVRCRLRSSHPVGSTLSGGLDSSSIVCVSRNLLRENGGGQLKTFSVIFDDPRGDERPYIASVLEGGDLEQHEIFGREHGAVKILDQMLETLDQPSFGTNLYIFWSIAESAKRAGVRVLLDGAFGDGTVSWGFAYMSELARSGRWLALNREAKALARIAQVRRRDVLERFAVRPMKEDLQHLWYSVRGKTPNGWHPDSIIDDSFAKRVGLQERWRRVQAPLARAPRSSREEHVMALTTALVPLGLELSEAVSSRFGIDWRGPFLDPRLAEFCLAIPGDQKLYNGLNRMVVRRGLEGILPETIRLRKDKGDASANLLRGLREDSAQLQRMALSDTECLSDYLNIEELRAAGERFSQTANGDDGSTMLKAAALSTWLKTMQSSPAVFG